MAEKFLIGITLLSLLVIPLIIMFWEMFGSEMYDNYKCNKKQNESLKKQVQFHLSISNKKDIKFFAERNVSSFDMKDLKLLTDRISYLNDCETIENDK